MGSIIKQIVRREPEERGFSMIVVWDQTMNEYFHSSYIDVHDAARLKFQLIANCALYHIFDFCVDTHMYNF